MEKGDGMSFAEFTYPLLQAWDWWHMFSTMDVQIQVGGSDQYGNIVAGIDAVRYIAQNHQSAGGRPHWLDSEGRLRDDAAPMGLTVPLLTTSSGEKFGKSAGNAVWLDASMTSPFDLYGVRLSRSDFFSHYQDYPTTDTCSSSSVPPTSTQAATSTSSHSFPSPKSKQSCASTPQTQDNVWHNTS